MEKLDGNDLFSNRPQKHTKITRTVTKAFVVVLIIWVLCYTIISIFVPNHKIQNPQKVLINRENTNLRRSDNKDKNDTGHIGEDISNMSSIFQSLLDNQQENEHNIERVGENGRNISSLLKSFKKDIVSIREEVSNLSLLFNDFKEHQERQQALEFSVQDFKFDRSTLHRINYISKDRRIICNKKVKAEMKNGDGSFRNYLGVRGTRQFSKFDIIYYEVVVNYELLENMSRSWLAFELGFSTLGTTDGHHYVGFQKQSWSIFCSNYMATNMMTLFYQVSRGASRIIKPLSPNIEGTTFSATFGFYVNGPEREITVYHRHVNDLKEIHTFSKVNFLKPLFPTFGVYSRNHVKVCLSLKTRSFIKTIPNLILKELI